MAKIQEKYVSHDHAASSLLKELPRSLVEWHGNPMDSGSAARLIDGLDKETCIRFEHDVLAMICRYWMAKEIKADYRQLSSRAGNTSDRAMLELVYGQLLISRKNSQASMHLAEGLLLAAQVLNSVDYFKLVQRHELLACLPLTDSPVEVFTLDSLLKEASVIKRLRAGDDPNYRAAHFDTVG